METPHFYLFVKVKYCRYLPLRSYSNVRFRFINEKAAWMLEKAHEFINPIVLLKEKC